MQTAMSTRVLLTGIAALFLATGTAQAAPPGYDPCLAKDDPIAQAECVQRQGTELWDFNNYKRCTATMVLKVDGEDDHAPWVSVSGLGARGGPSWSVLDKPFPLTVSKDDKVTVIFKRKHLAQLKAAVRFLEKCRAWVWDHNKQKAIYATPKEMKELDNED